MTAASELPAVADQVARANNTGRTPVVFVHGLWLLPSSWDRWAQHPAAQPVGIEGVDARVRLVAGQLVGLASFASTMRSTVPNSPRTIRPSPAGSAAKTLASATAASSWRRASRTASRSAPVTSGTSPDRTRTSTASAGTTASAAPTA